jgi:histidine ammonia-lyase
MSKHYVISADYWTLSEIGLLLESGQPIRIDESAMEKVRNCREYLNQYLGRNAAPVYGVNTGFGSLCDTVVSSDQLSQLQENLVKSHACGAGETIDRRLAKLMLLLKIKGLSYGHSGVQPATLERLVYFYNHDAVPVIYEQGSLGASGDLAPLAHLSLPLLGLGELCVAGKRMHASEFLKQHQLEPIVLQSKEGLALLNGTQFMSALGVWCWLRGKALCENATLIAAMSLDAFYGRKEPFDSSVHAVRAHHGQVEVAATMRKYLAGSEIQAVPKTHVQDPYSFRCIPQVHGATADVLGFAGSIFEREVNSVTDNPTIFPEEDKIISAGNFHGQPLAIALDHLAIALAELGSISERRVYKLISGTRALPAFLVANPGLNSGFMIPQYTAASMVSRNKQLCTPCSVDTIDSSNGQEDHVSMGANAANKTVQVVKNLTRILGIELFNAAQALDFRRPVKSSETIETLHRRFRERVPFVQQDVVMHPLMEEALCFVHGLNVADYE